jgi:hypothetical protein
MSAEEILFHAPVWIRKTFAKRGDRYDSFERQCCREWIRLLRWARQQSSAV